MSGMKAPQLKTDVETRAREWFVRLNDDDIEREDLLAWEQWLDADDEHRAAYGRVESAWRWMQVAEPLAPTAEALAADGYRAQMPVAQWRRRSQGRLKQIWPLAAGLAAVLAVAATGWLWSADHRIAPRQFATERARHLDAQLQDGSRVQLGAMTKLEVAYSAGRRDTSLVQGEALFHVAHDRQRPFVVHTPLAAITAVGTAFDVNLEAGAVTLTVSEGVVSVVPGAGGDESSGSAAPIRIRAGQRLRMEQNGDRLVVALSEGGPGATWATGSLEYRNVGLRSVIADVNRYATQPIIVADADLANLQYTGTVQLQAADTWVLGLPAAFPLTVEVNGRGQFILRHKPPAAADSNAAGPRSSDKKWPAQSRG